MNDGYIIWERLEQYAKIVRHKARTNILRIEGEGSVPVSAVHIITFQYTNNPRQYPSWQMKDE